MLFNDDSCMHWVFSKQYFSSAIFLLVSFMQDSTAHFLAKQNLHAKINYKGVWWGRPLYVSRQLTKPRPLIQDTLLTWLNSTCRTRDTHHSIISLCFSFAKHKGQSTTKLASGSDPRVAFLNTDDGQNGTRGGFQAKWLYRREAKARGASLKKTISAIFRSLVFFQLIFSRPPWKYFYTEPFFHGSSKFPESATS